MKVLFMLSLGVVLYAGIIDDIYKYEANSYIKTNDIKKLQNSLDKIKNKDDEVYYNLGNIAYKHENYKKAISYYNKIGTKTNKTLHNLGNSYAKNDQIQEAIEHYKKALDIKKDKDTKYN